MKESDPQTESQLEHQINNAQQQLSLNNLLPILIQQMQTMQTMMENMNHHHNSSRCGGRSRQILSCNDVNLHYQLWRELRVKKMSGMGLK